MDKLANMSHRVSSPLVTVSGQASQREGLQDLEEDSVVTVEIVKDSAKHAYRKKPEIKIEREGLSL